MDTTTHGDTTVDTTRTMDLEDVLRKIKACEALAANAGTEAEAAAAAAKAADLMAAYSIERTQLEIEAGTEHTGYGHRELDFGAVAWKANLGSAVAYSLFCKVVRTRTGTLDVIGHRDNVAAVFDIHSWLVKAVWHLAASHEDRPAGGPAATKWAYDFRHGAVNAITTRLGDRRREIERQQRAAAPSSTALVVMDDKLKETVSKLYPHLTRGRRMPSGNAYSNAFHAGRAAGSSVSLERPNGVSGPRGRLAS